MNKEHVLKPLLFLCLLALFSVPVPYADEIPDHVKETLCRDNCASERDAKIASCKKWATDKKACIAGAQEKFTPCDAKCNRYKPGQPEDPAQTSPAA